MESRTDWLMGFADPKYWEYKETLSGHLCGLCVGKKTGCNGGCKMDATKRSWCFDNAEALQVERAMLDWG